MPSSTDWKTRAAQHAYVLGADECGYGSWAGPLVVCAAVVPSNWVPPSKLDDSKRVAKADHEALSTLLRQVIPGFAIESAEASEIDEFGVVTALKRCYRSVVLQLKERFPDSLIVLDGEVKLSEVEHMNFPRADGLVPAVMAASIIGKYHHDEVMRKLAETYPGYQFASNVGYRSPAHLRGLTKLGLSPIHRRSYVPMDKIRTGAPIPSDADEGLALDDS